MVLGRPWLAASALLPSFYDYKFYLNLGDTKALRGNKCYDVTNRYRSWLALIVKSWGPLSDNAQLSVSITDVTVKVMLSGT